MSGILDKAKHMVFEETEAPPAKKVEPVPPAYTPPVQHYVSPVAVSIPAMDDGGVYERLRKATDFDATDVGVALQKYLAPLAGLSLDEHSKFKAAAVQAKAIDGLTDEKILATFDGLKVQLQHETDTFTASANHFEQVGVKETQDKIDAQGKEIAQRQQEIVDLTAKKQKAEMDLAIAVERLNQKKHDFSLAIMRRTQELDQQKSQYESLLKG